jgi:voltage-gated potassium channel
MSFMPIQRPLIRLSYRLADSARYQGVKRFFYTLLEDPSSRIRPYYDICMIALVLTSVSLLVYDTYADVGRFGNLFEHAVVGVFIVEYLLRFWIASDNHRIIIAHYERAAFVGEAFRAWPALKEILQHKWRYIRSPFAIIDLLAILPTYRPVRMLRLFLLFRLLKLFRYANSFAGFGQVLKEKRFELLTLSVFLAFLIFSAASALVIFEVDNPDSRINSFLDGIYWAVITVSTVGYGDIVPATPEGRLVTFLLILAGLGTFSFFASIIVSGFSERLPELRLRQVNAELERHGGHTILCGFGRVGQDLAAALERDGTRFVVVDSEEERYRLARRKGYYALLGRAEREDVLDVLQVVRAERILCLTGDDVINVSISLGARHRNPGILIIARANQPENVTKLKRAGADHTVTPFESVGRIAAQYIGQPVAFEALREVLSLKQGISVDAVRVNEGSFLLHKRVRELDWAGHKLILFGVVGDPQGRSIAAPTCFDLGAQRFFFNPAPELPLRPNDLIILFGHDYSLAHFKEWLAKASL